MMPCFQALGIIPVVKHLLNNACNVSSKLSLFKTSAGKSPMPTSILFLDSVLLILSLPY